MRGVHMAWPATRPLGSLGGERDDLRSSSSTRSSPDVANGRSAVRQGHADTLSQSMRMMPRQASVRLRMSLISPERTRRRPLRRYASVDSAPEVAGIGTQTARRDLRAHNVLLPAIGDPPRRPPAATRQHGAQIVQIGRSQSVDGLAGPTNSTRQPGTKNARIGRCSRSVDRAAIDTAQDSAPLSPSDYVDRLRRGEPFTLPPGAAHDVVVGRIYACTSPADLEWIGKVSDEHRKYVFALGSRGLAELPGLKPLDILLKAGLDPMYIYRSITDGAAFNITVWRPPPGDIRARCFGWDDIRSLIEDEYAGLWGEVIAPHWEAVVAAPFHEHERAFDASRTPGAMRAGNVGRKLKRGQAAIAKRAAIRIQAILRGYRTRNTQRHEPAKPSGHGNGLGATSLEIRMGEAILALKTPPALRSPEQVRRIITRLKHVPFFKTATASGNSSLAEMISSSVHCAEYPPGTNIVAQGETGKEFFAIMSGERAFPMDTPVSTSYSPLSCSGRG